MLRTHAPTMALFLALLLTGLLVVLVVERLRRKQIQESLTRRSNLEKYISAFSQRLAAIAPDKLEAEIEVGLKNVLLLEGGDRIGWYVSAQGSDSFERKYFATKSNIAAPPQLVTQHDVPWAMERLLRGEQVIIPALEDLPAHAHRERRFFEELHAKSVALVPSNHGPMAKGLLAVASTSAERRWAADLVGQLSVLGNVIASATLRTHAQWAQTDSEVRFDHLFEQASIGIALETLDGQLLHVNPAFCAMLGYSEEELLRSSCARFSHAEDLKIEEPLFHDLRARLRSNYQIDKRFIRSDGSCIWGRVSVSLLTRNRGQAPLVIGMVRDITLDKAVQEQLQTAKRRFQTTLDVLSAAIAILDNTGTIVATNADWSRSASEGQTRFQNFGVGTNFFELSAAVTGREAEAMWEVAWKVKLLLDGGSPGDPLLHRVHTQTCVEVWYQIMMARFDENGSPRVVLSYRDVTELMRAREELAQNEERLSMTLEASNTGAWEWDIATRRFRWRDNRNAGEREKEFEGDYHQFLAFVHPEDRENVAEATERALLGADFFSAEFRIGDGKGSQRWILGKGKVLRDATGSPVRMLGANVDITDLKQRDLELHELASRLIKAQEEERCRISRELHDDIGQRVSMLASELESLTQTSVANDQPPSVAIESLRQQADELATDIHDLSHELHSSKLQHLGLRAALKELCEKVAESRQFKVALHTDGAEAGLPPDLALCLFRVAQEALSNVVKHSRAKAVALQANRVGATFRLIVKDAGVGFNPSAASPGLGLIGMRERLRAVGGTLHVTSSPQAGTEVIAEVNLPELAASARA